MDASRKWLGISKTWWRRIRRALYTLFGLAVGVPALAFAIGYLVWDPANPHVVLAGLDKTIALDYADGTTMMKIVPPDGDREFVAYHDLPGKLVDAIVAVEDPTFWTNEGFEPSGIARAMITGVGGGSGITQQYIKNSTGDEDDTYFRKFKELVLATKITRQRSKEEILESYVNVVSFGRNTYGPAAAMNVYFGRRLDDISWSEAAFLAGMLQAPYGHDPATVGDAQAAKRWQYAADKLVERGYVSPQVRATMAYPGSEILTPGEAAAGKISYTDYHVEQQVLAELEAGGASLERLRREGATVRTTIDRQAQAAVELAVHDQLASQPDYFRAAVVSIDPRTGGVLAYQGGEGTTRDYAVMPHRSGSAFQPFVTLAQLMHGPGAAPVHIRQAAYDAGIPEFVDGERTLTQPDGVHIATTIGDGVYRLRPLDMAAAYATFAAGGTRITPHFIAEVRAGVPAFDDPTGKIAAMAKAMFGQGGLAGQFPLPEGDDNSDAWMIGSTPRATTAVWVGSDDERPLRDANGAKVTGDTMPASIWRAADSSAGLPGRPQPSITP